MKLTGLEIPCIYKNTNDYLLFDYTDEIQLGRELCSVRLIRLETADLFKSKIPAASDDGMIFDEYIAVITPVNYIIYNRDDALENKENQTSIDECTVEDEAGTNRNIGNIKNINLLKKVRDFIMEEVPGLTSDKLEMSIKI